MIKPYTGLPRFNKGDLLSAATLSGYVLNIYNKFNSITPDNLKTITTGQVIGIKKHNNLKYPNYCGMLSSDSIITVLQPGKKDYELTDAMAQKLVKKIDYILKAYEG